MAATFLAAGDDGEARFSAVQGSHLPAAELARQVRSWEAHLRGIDPLALAAIAHLPGRVATLTEVGGAHRAVLGNRDLRRAYRRIGAIDDARLLIRDDHRLVAAIALWRPLRSNPWGSSQLHLLATLQPLIEMAYVSALHVKPPLEDRLPPTLTPRQREVARLLAAGATNQEVARALRISPNTVKSHARAVLAEIGVASRRELMISLGEPAMP